VAPTEITNNWLDNPVSNRCKQLREDLEKTPWYHFMERIYIKSELRELEIECMRMAIEIAFNDLKK